MSKDLRPFGAALFCLIYFVPAETSERCTGWGETEICSDGYPCCSWGKVEYDTQYACCGAWRGVCCSHMSYCDGCCWPGTSCCQSCMGCCSKRSVRNDTVITIYDRPMRSEKRTDDPLLFSIGKDPLLFSIGKDPLLFSIGKDPIIEEQVVISKNVTEHAHSKRCAGLSQSCSTSADCCGALCRPTSCQQGYCMGSWCLGRGTPCHLGCQCCSGTCSVTSVFPGFCT